MGKGQFAIMRFAKYKGPEISRIEAHDERKKMQYASNPNIDIERSNLNYHLITPDRTYRATAERKIAESGCRTRSDSVRLVEVLFTASPEFFEYKKDTEVREFFERSLSFIKKSVPEENIVSAVVHMDEKTPHMHLSFVPLTEDNRLSAKEIVGNRKDLTKWQDNYYEYMVEKWQDLERGESAAQTGRKHIPPRLFKEVEHLDKESRRVARMLQEINMFNAKSKSADVRERIEKYFKEIERMKTELGRYEKSYEALKTEKSKLEVELADVKAASRTSIRRKLEVEKDLLELDTLRELIGNIPDAIIRSFAKKNGIDTYERKDR